MRRSAGAHRQDVACVQADLHPRTLCRIRYAAGPLDDRILHVAVMRASICSHGCRISSVNSDTPWRLSCGLCTGQHSRISFGSYLY